MLKLVNDDAAAEFSVINTKILHLIATRAAIVFKSI